MAAQCGKGPDVVIWAHDKVGEWADAGLIAPVEVSNEFLGKFSPKAWEAVIHKGRVWGIQSPWRLPLFITRNSSKVLTTGQFLNLFNYFV